MLTDLNGLWTQRSVVAALRALFPDHLISVAHIETMGVTPKWAERRLAPNGSRCAVDPLPDPDRALTKWSMVIWPENGSAVAHVSNVTVLRALRAVLDATAQQDPQPPATATEAAHLLRRALVQQGFPPSVIGTSYPHGAPAGNWTTGWRVVVPDGPVPVPPARLSLHHYPEGTFLAWIDRPIEDMGLVMINALRRCLTELGLVQVADMDLYGIPGAMRCGACQGLAPRLHVAHNPSPFAPLFVCPTCRAAVPQGA